MQDPSPFVDRKFSPGASPPSPPTSKGLSPHHMLENISEPLRGASSQLGGDGALGRGDPSRLLETALLALGPASSVGTSFGEDVALWRERERTVECPLWVGVPCAMAIAVATLPSVAPVERAEDNAIAGWPADTSMAVRLRRAMRPAAASLR